jgi:hypothetical protein
MQMPIQEMSQNIGTALFKKADTSRVQIIKIIWCKILYKIMNLKPINYLSKCS